MMIVSNYDQMGQLEFLVKTLPPKSQGYDVADTEHSLSDMGSAIGDLWRSSINAARSHRRIACPRCQ